MGIRALVRKTRRPRRGATSSRTLQVSEITPDLDISMLSVLLVAKPLKAAALIYWIRDRRRRRRAIA
jgi:hypothetical protein